MQDSELLKIIIRYELTLLLGVYFQHDIMLTWHKQSALSIVNNYLFCQICNDFYANMCLYHIRKSENPM